MGNVYNIANEWQFNDSINKYIVQVIFSDGNIQDLEETINFVV